MILRKWTYRDILRISQIEEECFGKTGWSFQMFADSFSLDNFYGICAEEDDEIVGFGCISFNGDDVDIDDIAVTENFRHRGIGAKILKDLIAESKSRKARKMFLEVRVSNSPAQILYLTHGFEGVYARVRYYPDGEDAIVMARKV